MNERSSHSHSVFISHINGVNSMGVLVLGNAVTREASLNLIDLVGSERFNVSFANGPDKERV